MRMIILIAAMALTIAAAQAEDMRSLSTAPNDTPAATPAQPADRPQYTARPALVDSAPSTARPTRRYDDRGYYDDTGYHPFPSRRGHVNRHAEPSRSYADRPRHRARWSARRIIAVLHRYGIYW